MPLRGRAFNAMWSDLLKGYDADRVLDERVAEIKAMLNSPPGRARTEGIAAPMGATCGNPRAFRMRQKVVYSSITGALVEFH